MNRKELAEFLKPPEFEVNCDQFVESVESQVVDKYPEIYIMAENKTKKNLDKRSNIIKAFKDTPLEQILTQRYLEFCHLIEHQAEKTSAFCNYANVEIIAYESSQQVLKKINKAILQVESLSLKHKGIKDWPTNQQIQQDLNQGLNDPEITPGTILTYRFT